MKKLLSEFKEFINRGNVIDLAVGIIVGGAFTAIVTSFANDIFKPFLQYLTSGSDGLTGLVWHGVDFSAFLSAVLNFLLTAIIVFFLVKLINKLHKASEAIVCKIEGSDPEDKTEAQPPTCPYCLEEIKAGATRCPHCAGDIAAYKEPEQVQESSSEKPSISE